MEKIYYVVRFDANCADEFDVSAFILMSKEDYDSAIRLTKEYFKRFPDYEEIELACGTNEFFAFESDKEYLASISKKKITEEQYKFMKKIFNGTDFNEGKQYFPYGIEGLMESLEEEDENHPMLKEAKKFYMY